MKKGGRGLSSTGKKETSHQTFGIYHYDYADLSQVGNPANGLVDGPQTPVEREPIGEPLSGAIHRCRKPEQSFPKPNDISPPLTSEVDEISRMLVNALALVESEVGEDKLGRRRRSRPRCPARRKHQHSQTQRCRRAHRQ